MMAQISEYSIIAYQRKPGSWRAAFVRKVLTENVVRGETVLSSVTPVDYASEEEAMLAAEQAIRKL
jgi:hypothetical protein